MPPRPDRRRCGIPAFHGPDIASALWHIILYPHPHQDQRHDLSLRNRLRHARPPPPREPPRQPRPEPVAALRRPHPRGLPVPRAGGAGRGALPDAWRAQHRASDRGRAGARAVGAADAWAVQCRGAGIATTRDHAGPADAAAGAGRAVAALVAAGAGTACGDGAGAGGTAVAAAGVVAARGSDAAAAGDGVAAAVAPGGGGRKDQGDAGEGRTPRTCCRGGGR